MSTSTEHALDTNAAIALMAADAALRARLGPAAAVAIPLVVLGELYFGAEHSQRVAENVARVDNIRSTTRILPMDVQTAREFGRVHHRLRSKGKPIPENDMWIAAVAIQHNLPLVSRDQHFNEVDGLHVISW